MSENSESPQILLEMSEPSFRTDDAISLGVANLYFVFVAWVSNFHELLPVLISFLATNSLLALIFWFSFRKSSKKDPILKLSLDGPLVRVPGGGWKVLDYNSIVSILTSRNAIQIQHLKKSYFVFIRQQDVRQFEALVRSPINKTTENFFPFLLKRIVFVVRNLKLFWVYLVVMGIVGFSPSSRSSLLNSASRFGNQRAIALLLSLGADINSPYHGKMPLTEALIHNDSGTAEYLIRRGATQ